MLSVTVITTTPRAVAVGLVTAATFVDIVAYAVAVPVLPDLASRLGATPTTIGLLFGSFGVTLLLVSMPIGAVSDRLGRRGPMIGASVAVAAASLLVVWSRGLPWLFAARMVQGAGDAIAWVVGFALIADLYGPEERGRVMGFVMSGTNLGFLLGPPIGGWLYELGGIRLPFLVVAVLAAATAVAFGFLRLPPRSHVGEPMSLGAVLRVPAIRLCIVVVVALSGTLAMAEPVFPLLFRATLGLGPTSIGLLFGIVALTAALMHPLSGRMSDRWDGRRLMLIGLLCTAALLPLFGMIESVRAAAGLMALLAVATSLVLTPSLAFMAQAASRAHIGSFGIVYGLYNVAWAIGLMIGPFAGGFLFETIGFVRLSLVWGGLLVAAAVLLGCAYRRPGHAAEEVR